MTFIVAAFLVTIAVIAFTLMVRPKDIPPPEPPAPAKHLEERKAQIYENLRDLQFEYRLGKLSDADYQRTKLGLQKELAGVMAEIDRVTGKEAKETKPVVAAKPETPANVCPHCSARFEKPLKFCGECGKPMAKVTA
ncbi:MAG: hypothetical protein SFV54_24725 [Bryobacteraceae bacterium]|nr:hypothetical protein [Bryobacteraceae bacterium]